MKLIVGLGNPDEKYKKTFHNLGFMCVDKALSDLGLDGQKLKCRAQVVEARLKGEKVIFAKPQTYMNLSGESVRELISFYKIDVKDVLVVYDDYDLNFGAVRIREKGSAGTHNGMRNIIAEIKDENFPRIRIGFKPREKSEIPLINYVLSGIREEDMPIMDKAIESASKAVIEFAEGVDVQTVMRKYNNSAKN